MWNNENDVNKTKQNLCEATRDAGKRRTASKKTEDKTHKENDLHWALQKKEKRNKIK